MKKFNVQEIELKGSNLIEASAGTGKTYSVAILVLRLILEKKIPIDKILMVTFTNAAAAELELRIRKFVRLAYRYASEGKICEEEKILDVVNNAEKETRLSVLKTALQSLDDLSVMTIHSFCQKTIGEFTFETRQSFDYEIITDDSGMLKNAANKFVREVLNSLEYEDFTHLTEGLKIENMDQLLRKHLQGMKFLDAEDHVELTAIEKNRDEKHAALKKAIEENFDKIKASDIGNRTDLGKNRTSPEVFLPQFIKFCCNQRKYIEKFEFIYYPYGKEYSEAFDNASLVYIDFFKKAEEAIKHIKQKRGYISYDDQIKTIHTALQNPYFINNLRDKYDAVFIDEFQDTDKYQYEIFSEVFKGKTIFYIGDPKQSIYGWRGADLDTYKIAKSNVDLIVPSLDKNYRSTPRLLKALEKIMGHSKMFLDEDILFESVESGNDELGDISIDGQEVPPITLWKFRPNDFESNYEKISGEVLMLLSGDNTINGEKITPKDIGILTRTNDEARATKKALAKLGIPSVLRDEKRVMSSDESDLIRYLLIAVLKPKRGEILRVLNLPQFGYSPVPVRKEEKSDQHKELVELQKLEEDKHINNFIALRRVLQKEGVYNMIARFLDIYGIRKRCMEDVEGQRVLSNINHIAEILHQLARKTRMTPDELVVWLQRSKDEANEEYQLRVESDEDAVQISSIHKAKGLQYKIVFAPFLSMFPRGYINGQVISFKKEVPVKDEKESQKEYFFTMKFSDKEKADQALKRHQDEQENRRLIYVALTRAVYKCYISLVPKSRKYRGGKESNVESSLSTILSHYSGGSDLIEEVDFSKEETETKEQKEKIKKWKPEVNDTPLTFSPRKTDLNTKALDVPLQLHSFSGLRGKGHSVPFEVLTINNDYDKFIFLDLPRGATAGSALHSIFERLHFQKPETWEQTLKDAAIYYKSVLKEEWKQYFIDMVEHTMQAKITTKGDSFRLAEVNDSRKIMEMQFNFSLKNSVSKETIDQLLGDVARLGGDASLQGLMTGFIDLIFEHNNKFYILDWKSNYLGNTLEDYSQQAVKKAMIASNYTLQYLIYTIAVKRWLESRLPDFDYDRDFGGVIYLYLRGIRKGKDTGIYFSKPEKEKIQALDAMLS